jgi:serine/threonine-protein kinase
MNALGAVGGVVAGKYCIERLIARGGGLVFEATHLTLFQRCAIKVLAPEALAAPSAHERFLREARAVVRLNHDHIVKVFDVGELIL